MAKLRQEQIYGVTITAKSDGWTHSSSLSMPFYTHFQILRALASQHWYCFFSHIWWDLNRGSRWFSADLYRNYIITLGVFACQDQSFGVGRDYALHPSTAHRNSFSGWNYHQHVIMAPHDPHYTHRASFLDVPAIRGAVFLETHTIFRIWLVIRSKNQKEQSWLLTLLWGALHGHHLRGFDLQATARNLETNPCCSLSCQQRLMISRMEQP